MNQECRLGSLFLITIGVRFLFLDSLSLQLTERVPNLRLSDRGVVLRMGDTRRLHRVLTVWRDPSGHHRRCLSRLPRDSTRKRVDPLQSFRRTSSTVYRLLIGPFPPVSSFVSPLSYTFPVLFQPLLHQEVSRRPPTGHRAFPLPGSLSFLRRLTHPEMAVLPSP